MQISQNHIRPVINGISVFLSCILLIYFFTNITDNPVLKIGFAAAAVYVDLLAQYILGLAIAYLRAVRNVKAGILLFCFTIYVLGCSIPSDISFFMAEINQKEQIASSYKDFTDITKDQIAQNKTSIDALNRQLGTEAKTGYGVRSQAAVEELNRLKDEQRTLKQSLMQSSQSSTKLFKNPYTSLGEVLKVSANSIKVFTFLILVGLICLGAILTPWQIEIQEAEGHNADEEFSAVPAMGENAPEAFMIGENVQEEAIIDMTAAGKEHESNIDANTEELLTFIRAANKFGGGRALHGDLVISQKTGIPVQRCAEYKKILSWVKINGEPLVVRRQGESEA